MNAKDFESHFGAFHAFNRSKGLSERTLTLYQAGLRVFLNWFLDTHGDEAEITARRIRDFSVARLEHGNSPATVRVYMGAVRCFYSFLVLDEVVTEEHNPMRLVPKVRVSRSQIEPLSKEQISRFLSMFNQRSPADYRNYTVCLLILDTGLRAGEALGLRVEDIDLDRVAIRVNGKGGKWRTVYFGQQMKAKLIHYLEHCRPWFYDSSFLFPSASPSAKHPTIQVHQFSAIVTRMMDLADIPRCHSSAHRLRHTFATTFLRRGGNVFALQKLLGHSTLEMTKRYVTLTDQDVANQHREASPLDGMEL